MNELQSDDFFIPQDFFKLQPKPELSATRTLVKDFWKNSSGWADIFPLDECVE
jgi:hypothetical protein